MINFLKKYWVLIVIFIFFAFFRFYNLDQRIIFDWDQEQFSYQASNILEKGNLTLIGPRVNNDRGFFLAPYFNYLLLPFYLITKLHPNALILFVIFSNIIFFGSSYFILNKIFNSKVSLVFLSLWSINYLMLTYDTIAWNPILILLGVIIAIFNLFNIYKNKNASDYLILGLTLGFFYNMHFQFIFLSLFVFIFILLNIKQKNFINLKKAGALITGFMITLIPLFVFDLRNDFLNAKLFFSFFFQPETNATRDLFSWIPVFTNVVHPFIYLKNNSLTFLFYIAIIAVVFFLIKKSKGFHALFYKSFLVIWFISPIVFSLYGKRPSEYYFLYLYPFIIIALSDFLLKLKNKIYVFAVIIYLSVINYSFLTSQLQSNKLGLNIKDKTIQTLKANIDETKKFNVTIDAPLGFHNGYKYLLDWYKIPQSGNFTDPLIQIKLPPVEVDIKVSDVIGLKIPKEVRK